MGKDVSEQWEKDSAGESPMSRSVYFTGTGLVPIKSDHLSLFFEPIEQPPDSPQPFPNWQPVKCSDEYCGWHGPAAKSVRWGEGDPHQYCPKCWNKVVKHESNGGSP